MTTTTTKKKNSNPVPKPLQRAYSILEKYSVLTANMVSESLIEDFTLLVSQRLIESRWYKHKDTQLYTRIYYLPGTKDDQIEKIMNWMDGRHLTKEIE